MGAPEETPARPVLRVVSGEPTPEELAALLAVVAGRSGAVEEPPAPTPVGTWGDRRHQLRTPLRRGPGAWVASGRPGA